MTPDPDYLVRRFAAFLDRAWPAIAHLAVRPGLIDDWLQANWELMVESLCGPGVSLEVYGEGADCNESGSRVWKADALPTHAIVCTAEGGVLDLLSGSVVAVAAPGPRLEALVTWDGSWHRVGPPFDCVLVEDQGTARVFRSADVVFGLQALGTGAA